MGNCHHLTYLNNKIVGDPLELKMFEKSGWDFEGNNLMKLTNSKVYPNLHVDVIKKFHFS